MKRYLFYWLALLLAVLPLAAAAETKPADLQKKIGDAVRAEQKAQGAAEQWSAERAALQSEVREIETRLKWLKYQRQKYENYVHKQEESIAELDRKKREIERINLALEPYLAETVERLAEFIDQDLDFLPEERQKRLTFLRDSLSDYRLELGEKLRRVLEALRVEAEYGRTVDLSQTDLELEGEPVQVSLLRVGRLALYYRTPDGRRLGWLSRDSREWQPLSHSYGRELIRATEMAERKRAVELVVLPLGRPVQ